MRTGLGATEEPPADLVAAFMSDIQTPRTPHISSERLAKRLGLEPADLDRTVGMHPGTPRDAPASDELQSRYRTLIDVVLAAAAVTGDLDAAIRWVIVEPIADYRGRTAAELVADGHADAVVAYLQDLTIAATG